MNAIRYGIFSTLLIVIMSSSVAAQTLFGTSGLYDGWANVQLDEPRLYALWSPNISCITVHASSTTSDFSGTGSGEGLATWSTEGLWLGLELPCSLDERWGLWLTGWYFFPGNQQVEIWGLGQRPSSYSPRELSGNVHFFRQWFSAEPGREISISG